MIIARIMKGPVNPYIKQPLYKDTFINKVNNCKGNLYINEYDYKSLQSILQDELNKLISEDQAKAIGDSLIDFLTAIYNDNSI